MLYHWIWWLFKRFYHSKTMFCICFNVTEQIICSFDTMVMCVFAINEIDNSSWISNQPKRRLKNDLFANMCTRHQTTYGWFVQCMNTWRNVFSDENNFEKIEFSDLRGVYLQRSCLNNDLTENAMRHLLIFVYCFLNTAIDKAVHDEYLLEQSVGFSRKIQLSKC